MPIPDTFGKQKETIEWTPFTKPEFRIKGYWSFDTPPKRYYKIIERVTPAYWIDLPGIYESEESAKKEIDRLTKKMVISNG